jgi:DnaJ-domain-containing protein 1
MKKRDLYNNALGLFALGLFLTVLSLLSFWSTISFLNHSEIAIVKNFTNESPKLFTKNEAEILNCAYWQAINPKFEIRKSFDAIFYGIIAGHYDTFKNQVIYDTRDSKRCCLNSFGGIWGETCAIFLITVTVFLLAILESIKILSNSDSTIIASPNNFIFSLNQIVKKIIWRFVIKHYPNPISYAEITENIIGMISCLSNQPNKRINDQLISCERILKDLFKNNTYELTSGLRFFRQVRAENIPFEVYANRFAKQFRHIPFMYDTMYETLLLIAAQDGISSREQKLLNSAKKIFHLSDDYISGLHTSVKVDFTNAKEDLDAEDQAQFSNKMEDIKQNETEYNPYKILGCKSSDPPHVIKKSYRKLVLRYHPDRLRMEPNLTEKLKQNALKHFYEIQQAYEKIFG